MLSNETLFQIVNQEFQNQISASEEQHGLLSITVSSDSILNVLSFLKTNSELNFFFLTDLCGLHDPQQVGKELGVIYHLHNMITNTRIRVKTFISIEHPVIASATSLFASANWQERETYDFFGIQFEGHPNLKRILNVDHMDYFPMRKEYPLEDTTRTDKDDRFFGRTPQQITS